MDYASWASKNKKSIAREFVRKIDYEKSTTPSGIFTAGLPGAGKTEFTLELIESIEPKPLRIDMDEIAQLIEGYKPELADKFRGGASIILSRIYDEIIKNKFNFIFDGTFSSAGSIANFERAIRHDYKVKLYYIHQDPLVAWQFTKDRELVEHRAIDKAGFVNTYFKIIHNLHDLRDNYKDVTISVVIKDQRNKIGLIVENANERLFDIIPKFFTEEELIAAII